MEARSPDSVSVPAVPSSEWTGTLIAEWTDRGLAEDDEQNLRDTVGAVGLVAVLGAVALLTIRAAALMALACVALMPGAVWILISPRIKSRRRSLDRITLTLDPDLLRLTRQAGESTETWELPRASAGRLIRWVASQKSIEAASLQLEDNAGSVRLDLRERRVAVTVAPFDLDLASPSIVPGQMPLDVLIGSWWPDPNRRMSRIRPSRFLPRLSADWPWGQHDLNEYAGWRASQRRVGALILVAGAVLSAVLAASLMALMVIRPLSGSLAVEGWVLAVACAVSAGFLGFVGLRALVTERPKK
jgi:hypothetical protein